MSGNGNAMGGMVVDSGRFDWSQNDKFPSLSQPEPAYHGLRFHETFGDLAMTVHGHAVGLRDLGATMAPINAFLTIKLGRASCRERVCQYGLDRGGRRFIKKNKQNKADI